jgi:hypothetical protein
MPKTADCAETVDARKSRDRSRDRMDMEGRLLPGGAIIYTGQKK